MFQTVREKLFLSFLLIALIPLLIFGISTYLHITQSLENELQLTTGKDMDQANQFIVNMLQSVKEDARMFAANPLVKQGEHELPVFYDKQEDVVLGYNKPNGTMASRIFTEFERYAWTHPNVAYVYLGTEDGGYLQWPQKKVGKAGYNPKYRPWYKQALQNPGQVMLSEPYPSFLGDNFIISTTTTVNNEQGQLIGVMGIDISLTQLSGFVGASNKNNQNPLFLFTQDGIILTHPNPDMHFQHISKLDIGTRSGEEDRDHDWHRLVRDREGFFATTMQGRDVLIHFQTSPETGWKLATVTDKAELIAKNRQVAINISLAVLLLLILMVWTIPFITRFLTRPLDEIVTHLKELQKGNFIATLSSVILRREDEIGEVAQAVDIMQKERYQAEEQLKKSNEELAGLFEQLTSTEEELRAQFEELWDKQKKIEKSEERYRLATEGANDAIWDWDIRTNQMVISKRWLDQLPWSVEEDMDVAKLWWQSIHPNDLAQADACLREHLAGQTAVYLCEYRIKDKRGQNLWVMARGKALFDENGTAVRMAGSFTNITEHKMRELQIQHMAYYDSLTGLPNRVAIVEQLAAETKQQAAQGAILFIDLDNFKLVNDSFGYAQGDRLLVDVARQLQVIAGEHFVARLGGDEFIILLKGIVKPAVVESLAKQITQAIDQPFGADDNYFMVTSSVGIALYPQDGNQPDKLMRSADIALHQAKRKGKSCYQWFQERFEQQMLARLYMEKGLREAIANNHLVLHYQPIVDLVTGTAVGLEALVRWQHPERGLAFPDQFMSVAEESGLIVDMGQWVLRAACRFGKELLDNGKELNLAVNVSVKELLQADFVDQVALVLSDTAFPSRYLELEIVETLLIENFSVAIPKLRALRSMGVQISLDDFGTGYSSLHYLTELPIDIIKIDRSFLAGAMKSNKQAAIVETMVVLAHRLQLTVVAEGVETEEQRQFLKQLCCDKVQGYLISKPVNQAKVYELI